MFIRDKELKEYVKAPATQEKIAVKKTGTIEELRLKVSKAFEAGKIWQSLSWRKRHSCVCSMRNYLINEADSIAKIISLCTGKTIIDALATEVVPAVIAAGYYSKAAKKFLKPEKIKKSSVFFWNKGAYLHYEPWGAVGIISPWNYPFGIPFHETVMAITAGNGVVLKVAAQAQPVAEVFEKMALSAGFPENLFSSVHLPGAVSGQAFLESGIKKLFFTGSVSVGRELLKLSAEKFIPVNLELGGNDAMIVCADANLRRAAAGAVWGGLSNCGQSCGGVERIYVAADVYDQFTAYLAENVSSLRQGHGFDVDLGSLTTQKQKQVVIDHIKDAVQKGAFVRASSSEDILPSDVGGDLFHPAVMLENTTHEMDVMKHETFGPVLAVCRVNSIEEAISLTNDSYLGLSASVWTKNRKTADLIACKLEAGTIMVNDHLMSHGMPEIPWGGFKMSGVGRTHGYSGMLEMYQEKCVVHDKTHFFPRNIWWPPYSKEIYNGLKHALSALFARSFIKRIVSVLKVIKFYIKYSKNRK